MRLESFSNHQIVTLAVFLLGGENKYIDREDIAVKANEITPGRFNWRKYTENIDLDAVGVALRDAKKEKNGGLLIGTNSTGWMLSPKGLVWSTSLGHDFVENYFPKYRKDSWIANKESECLRLKNTRAYKLFVDGQIDAINLQDFFQFTRVNEYYQRNTRKKRYAVIENVIVEDNLLLELWSFLKGKFKEEFSKND